jgi:hypothetical protein
VLRLVGGAGFYGRRMVLGVVGHDAVVGTAGAGAADDLVIDVTAFDRGTHVVVEQALLMPEVPVAEFGGIDRSLEGQRGSSRMRLSYATEPRTWTPRSHGSCRYRRHHRVRTD